MKTELNIAILVGSARRGSVNRQLGQVVARQIENQGAKADLIEAEAHDFPIYNGDLEADGLPSGLPELARRIAAADGLVVISPEYNGFPTPLLKNTIDWLSRTDEPVFVGKPTVLLSASPGALGGMRGLRVLRELLSNLNLLVIPQQYSLRDAFNAFDDVAGGGLKDAKAETAVGNVVLALLDLAGRLAV